MGRREFEVRATLLVSPDQAIDFLMDLARHRGLHPFLQSAQVVATGSSSDGPWWDWRVVERPPLGPFRFTLRFPARMTRTSATSMTARVRAAPRCWLTSTTGAVPDEGGCRLLERTTVTAPWPVLGYMARHGEEAHARTYRHLPEVLDSP